MIETRPTAINLKWALDRLTQSLENISENERPTKAMDLAHEVAEEDVFINKSIGEHGLELVKSIAERKKNGCFISYVVSMIHLPIIYYIVNIW